MSTYLQLVQVAQRECGVSGGAIPSVLNQTGMFKKLIEWVADSDYEIQSLHGDWDFLWSQWEANTIAAPATSQYTKPSDFGAWDEESFMLDYDSATYSHLRTMGYKNWRRNFRNGVLTQSRPSYVIVLPDSNVILHSVPDAVYKLSADYWRTPTRLTVNTSESPIPVPFERAIIAGAKMKYAEDQGVPEILSNSQIENEDWITRLEGDQLPGQQHRRMNESPIEDNAVMIG